MAPREVARILADLALVEGVAHDGAAADRVAYDRAASPGAAPGEARPSLPQRLVLACAAALPVGGVGMVLMTDAGPSGVTVASDDTAAALEALQLGLGVGPGVDASRTGRPVLVDDLATVPQRWPGFVEGAARLGVGAVFAYPLHVGAIRLGVLDLYLDRPGALDEAEQRSVLDYADAAVAVLLHVQDEASGAGNGAGVVEMFVDHAEVHQATGVAAVQAGVDVATALALLRARAFATGRPLLDLARDVMARRVVFRPGGEDAP